MTNTTSNPSSPVGAVVYRSTDAGHEVLLLRRLPEPDAAPEEDIWEFPGAVYGEHETPDQAALRLVLELVGLSCEVERPLEIPGASFLLLHYLSGDLKPDASRLAEVGWFDLETARDIVSYRVNMQALQKAETALENA